MNFVICCENNLLHNWMSFASWYSLNQQFSDAEVKIAVKRSLPRHDLFRWTEKCKVPRQFFTSQLDNESDILFISPSVMAVRDCGEKLGPVPVQSPIMATLVDYSEGCGNFVPSEWINRMDAPFFRATKKFGTSELTVNEVAVFRLWEKMYSLFCSVKI